MATHLDLEEQEQLDQLKHFWNRYGNLITALALLVALGVAGVNVWNWWQRDQAVKAGAMYDEIDKTVQAGDADRAAALFAGLKDRYPRTAFAQQAGLLVARLQFERGQADNARATLSWVAEHGTETEYQRNQHVFQPPTGTIPGDGVRSRGWPRARRRPRRRAAARALPPPAQRARRPARQAGAP